MPERRAAARKKRRFLVEFSLQGSHCTGFTYDISATGIFVRSIRMPEPGTVMTVNLHIARGKSIDLKGKVVRAFRVPVGLSRLIPSGFSMRLADPPGDYDALVASLE